MSPRLRLSPRARLAELHGEAVLLHLGSGRYFAANPTAVTLLRALGTDAGASREELVDALVARHGAAPDRAGADVDAWLARLREAALLADPAPGVP